MINKELLKGTTELLVLRTLKEEPLYGYGIIKKISLISNGIFEFKEGTLYPILHALEKNGDIVSFWSEETGGRKRKYYKLTEGGLRQMTEKKAEWETFSTLVQSILNQGV